MAKLVRCYTLGELANDESQNEILLNTTADTELHIVMDQLGRTIIKLPYGNRFNIVDGNIIIYDK